MFHQIYRPRYCLVLFMVILTTCTTVRPDPVGEQRQKYQDVSRKSWTKDTPRPLTVTVWYPAKAGTAERKTSIGIFNTGLSARGAEISSLKERYPLIALSHGTGGSAASISWLGKRLARRGYIAAAVNHHGNTGAERKKVLQGFLLWWERPRDISQVISQLLADKYFGQKIDRDRIGVAGFSLGGYTALASVGARLEIEKWEGYCVERSGDPTCNLPPEAPFNKDDVNRFLQSDIYLESIKDANNNYADGRIRAAYVIAPVLTPIMSTVSLNKISLPVKIVTGDHDDQSVSELNALPLAKVIPQAQLLIIPQAGHYTFLTQGTILACIFAARYFKDPRSVDRVKIQKKVGDDAADFFDRSLDYKK